MFRRLKKEPIAALLVTLLLVAGILGATSWSTVWSRFDRLWVGDTSDSATYTLGDDDAFVNGDFEVGGGTFVQTTSNTSSIAITLAASDSGQIFYEATTSLTTGSVNIVYTLPADPTGLEFTFVLGGVSGNKVAITPASGDTILGASAADAYIWADAVGETLMLKGVNSSGWGQIGKEGTWTYDPA